jgi:putative endonuclease
MLYFVYLLECADGKYYVGVTNNLYKRFKEHQEGLKLDSYTSVRLPLHLKYYMVFDSIYDAIKTEKKLKKWSRIKKEAFFERDWQKMHELSRCLNKTSHKNRLK